jgi:3-phosphoshikimate 1-carboxyvinyltransferase
MKAIIKRSTISGSIAAPQSKSYAIRLIFLSLLTDISIENLIISEDVLDALNAISVFNVNFNDNRFYRPPILKLYRDYIYFKGSATVLRMFIPIVAVIGGKITIDGSESLRRRPLNAIINALGEKGVKFSGNRLPITIEGRVKDPYIDIYGGESSQYISGLIIALMLAGGGAINIRGKVSSKSYIYLTSEIINSLGGSIYIYNNRIVVEPSRDIKSYRGTIPGDYLLASFYAASALLTNGELSIHGLPKPFSFFGDHSIVDIYRSMGATSLYRDNIWYVKSSDGYKPIDLDIDDTPDLAPSIAPLATIANGKTIIRGVERLAIKESNRRDTIALTLRSFGIEAFNKEDYIEIIGGELREGSIICPDDHRIAMMATSIALRSGGSIDKAECVYKSNPSFWKDLELLGGGIYLV